MGNPKYTIRKSVNAQYYWTLTATNGEIILKSSETYAFKQGCLNSINASKVCVLDKHFKRGVAVNGQYFFIQIANNGEELGISEYYTTAISRDNGIDSVKRNAPIASIEDLT